MPKVANQCLGQNIKKKRCGLKTTNENGYCYNHQDQFVETKPKKKVKEDVKKTKKVKEVPKSKSPKEQEKPNDCPICFCSLKEEKNALECGHWTHLECIKKCIKPECPICRHPVKVSKDIQKKMEKKRKEVRDSYNNAMIRRYYENPSRTSRTFFSPPQDINFARILVRFLEEIHNL